MTLKRPIYECLNNLSDYLGNKTNRTGKQFIQLKRFIDDAKCNESSDCDRCGIKIQIHSVLDFAIFYFETFLDLRTSMSDKVSAIYVNINSDLRTGQEKRYHPKAKIELIIVRVTSMVLQVLN